MDEDSKKPTGFKIFDDETPAADAEETEILLDKSMVAPDPGPSSAGASVKPKKSRPSGRLRAFFTILLILCALGAIGGGMYAVYDRMNERLNRIETAGTQEMAGLLNHMDERLGLFSTQFAAQHAEMQLQIEKAAKQAQENTTGIQGLQRTINTQGQTLEREISTLENRIEKLDRHNQSALALTTNEMDALEKRIDAGENRIDALAAAAETTGEVASTVDAIQDDLNNFRKRLDSFSPDEITREMSAEIAEAKQEFNRQIETTNHRLDQKLVALENEISAIEAMMRSLRNLTLQKDNGLPEIIEEDLGELP